MGYIIKHIAIWPARHTDGTSNERMNKKDAQCYKYHKNKILNKLSLKELWTIFTKHEQYLLAMRSMWLRKLNWFHPCEGAVSLENGVDWSGTVPWFASCDTGKYCRCCCYINDQHFTHAQFCIHIKTRHEWNVCKCAMFNGVCLINTPSVVFM